MIGSLCKVTALITIDHLLDDVRKSFGKKFSQLIIDGNLEATRRGYEEVQEG
jgi:pyruvate ferredoxin oxidoreductase gamma subunit